MNKIIDILVDLWIYDINFLSQKWVIFTIIPAIFYIVFMIVKWGIVTLPLWLPFSILANSLRKEAPVKLKTKEIKENK